MLSFQHVTNREKFSWSPFHFWSLVHWQHFSWRGPGIKGSSATWGWLEDINTAGATPSSPAHLPRVSLERGQHCTGICWWPVQMWAWARHSSLAFDVPPSSPAQFLLTSCVTPVSPRRCGHQLLFFSLGCSTPISSSRGQEKEALKVRADSQPPGKLQASFKTPVIFFLSVKWGLSITLAPATVSRKVKQCD